MIFTNKSNRYLYVMDREERYATQVVDWMVRETKIDDSHEDPSQWNIYAPHMSRWISPLGFISPNNRHWTSFENHVIDIYGLDWDYVGPVWDNYLKEVTKNFRLLARKAMGDDTPPWDMQYDYLAEGLNNQKYLHKVLDRMVDETMVEYGEVEAPIAYPTWVIDDNEGVDLAVLLDSGYEHWNFKEFSDYVKDMYGLTNDETMDIWEPYLDGINEKFSLYIAQNNLKHPWTSHWVNESSEDLNVTVHKAVDDTFKKNKGLKGQHRITRYFMKHYELDKWEADQAMVQYLSKQQSMNESVDISYTDDKDFPFLNQVATHVMKETEISRNAVMFPFIDGYISDGNFHKYFNGTPYDQLPFEATLKVDEYLNLFGLTENEKEIWWDIYVIKVIDAVNERDQEIERRRE